MWSEDFHDDFNKRRRNTVMKIDEEEHDGEAGDYKTGHKNKKSLVKMRRTRLLSLDNEGILYVRNKPVVEEVLVESPSKESIFEHDRIKRGSLEQDDISITESENSSPESSEYEKKINVSASHIKLNKRLEHYRRMKKIWEHRAPRPDQKHTYVNFQYKLKSVKQPWHIEALYHFIKYWDWLMIILTVITFYLLTYASVFAFHQITLFRIVYMCDIMFLFDTICRVSLETWRCKHQVPFLIFLSPYTTQTFIADALSIVPIERVAMFLIGTQNLDTLNYYDFLRYNRFFRFMRIFSFLDEAEKQRRISERLHFFLKYSLIYIIFIQIVTCSYFLFTGMDPIEILFQKPIDSDKTWLEGFQASKPAFKRPNHFDYFSISVYFATTVVTTTGYGDLDSNYSIAEMLFSISVMLLGAILFRGLFQSRLTNFELKQDGARYELFFRVQALMSHLKNIQTHALFQQKVSEFYPLLWNFRSGVMEVPFFTSLPRSMQLDIKYDFCEAMFHKCPIFRGLNEAFLRAVASTIEVGLYNPGMLLCAQGSYAMRMFYILQGELIARSKFTTTSQDGRYDVRRNGVILRPGCFIGEMNLFFSYPYSTSIETRTCCQLIKIEKEGLMDILTRFPEITKEMRRRVKSRITTLHRYHKRKGKDPLHWIECSNLGYADGDGKYIPKNKFPVILRSATGLNRRIRQDVVDDSKEMVIAEFPCIDKSYEKNYTEPYMNSLIPNIFSPNKRWIHYWTRMIILLALYTAFIDPYCIVFNVTSGFQELLCSIAWSLPTTIAIFTIYVFDVFLEITQSVPVTGLYYQIREGFKIQKSNPFIWTDTFSAIFCLATSVLGRRAISFAHYTHIASAVCSCCRLWKVNRYLQYLDNTYPTCVFYFRLAKTILIILYGTHFLACINFGLACPAVSREHPPVCRKLTWLNSYQLHDGDNYKLHYEYLAKSSPYLISFYYSCATLTTAGFGDFSSQSRYEMLTIVIFELLSFYILCYSAAILTSALSCVVRPRLIFENKMVAVKKFMTHYGIHETLQNRVLEHYYLQLKYWKLLLPHNTHHYMFDAPSYLHEDVLYIEIEPYLDCVPLFSKIDPKLTVEIARTLRRYLLPPGVIFLRKSEVRRQMYIIAQGSVGFYTDKLDVPYCVLEASCYFGIRDLLFAEPAHYHVQTMSYCLIFEIELSDLNLVVSKDPGLEQLINDNRTSLHAHIEAMVMEYSHHKVRVVEVARVNKSWILMPTKNDEHYENCTLQEYEEAYKLARNGWIFKKFLMKKSINPTGDFAKWWTFLMGCVSTLTIVFLINESFMQVRSFPFRMVQLILDVFNIIDIYIRMHWGFYNENGILVSHPLFTMNNYVFDGTFVYDIIFTFSYEAILPVLGITNYSGESGAVHWYTKFRWTRIGQVLRIPVVINICHDIFKNRSTVLLILYIFATIALCTSLASIASYIACPVGNSRFKPTDLKGYPFCNRDSWASTKSSLAVGSLYERWVVGVYYTSQVILLIGYGDMAKIIENEMILLITMMLFGCICMVCVLSDITAAEVDLDDARLNYFETLKRMNKIMVRERVHPSLIANVMEFMKHTWDKSRALQPKQLFADLHPALQSDLYKNFVGDKLTSVPIFNGLRENVMRHLCQTLMKLFFSKGERMARFGNLEMEMYIIVEGKVWITDKNRRWITTLRPGQAFGESSLVLGNRRNFNAFAGSTVEVFCISLSGYKDLLQRYPTTEDDLKRRLIKNGNHDLFQRQIHRDKAKNSRELIKAQTKKIHSILRIKHQYDSDFRKIKFKNWWTGRVVSYGNEELISHMPFLYFTTPGSKFKFLIHPECQLMKQFMDFVAIICLFTAALGVLESSFGDKDGLDLLRTPWTQIRITLEAIMYVKIVSRFVTPFEFRDKIYCKSYKKIAYNYMTSLLFPLDIVSSFPAYAFLNYQDWTRYLPLLRLLRLYHFYSHQHKKVMDITRSMFRQKVSLSVISFLLIAHILACIFYIISKCTCADGNMSLDTCESIDLMCPPRTWTYQFLQDNPLDPDTERFYATQVWRWYIRSLYWVITTISTTGFGSIVPQNIPEILIAIACIFCGSFLLSVILSNFTSGISSLTQSHREYFFQVNILLSYFKNFGIAKEREKKIISYFGNYWDKCRGFPYNKTTSILPISMRIDVCYALYSSVLEDCSLVKECSKDTSFLRQLCVTVKHAYYLPGTPIASAGDSALLLHFVYRGNVSSSLIHNNKLIIEGTYVVSEAFGKHGSLLHDQFYSKTYRAETHAEVLTLSQFDILSLATNFPHFSKTLQKYIDEFIPKRSGVFTIFEHEEKEREEREEHEREVQKMTETKKILKEKEREWRPIILTEKQRKEQEEDILRDKLRRFSLI